MTVGENIRKIRKQKGLTLKQLGNMIGTTEAYIRAYECGRRNPKPASLERIANVLEVNVEALMNNEIDDVAAMHKLFQVFKKYDGHLFKYEDSSGNNQIGISFMELSDMNIWYQQYELYLEKLKECEKIKDVTLKANSMLQAEAEFESWMDCFR